jgi:REP element-mobilizing transposase RayT
VPSKPRDRDAGLFHVFTRCVYASPSLYRDDVDRLEFLRYLARTTVRSGWSCIAFCLMTTHYHLVVDVADDVLPKGMHSLNLAYARAFNLRYGLKGRVQFRPYGASRIHSEGDFLTRYRYVVRNPVRAGLCDRAEEWQWSSFPGTIGVAEPHSFIDDRRVLTLFSSASELSAHVNEAR